MEKVNFKDTIEKLRDTGFCPVPDKVEIRVPNAKDVLWRGIQYFTGGNARWLPEYDEVAAWLAGNQGRGLLCYGNCGRGKTLLCGKIIPIAINFFCRKITAVKDAQQMNKEVDALKKEHLLCIDDIGTEQELVKYGERRMAFCEIADEAEKKGHLLLLTTNLSLNEISVKYGERTMDRLVAVTKRVQFRGESLRK